MNHADRGDKFDVDLAVKDARPNEFDALMIPGGLFNPDGLRSDRNALEFAQHFFREHKPVAVICHGPQVLISADLVRGRKMTSWPAIQADMRNAGAKWVDEEVVVDNGLVSSRKPDDIPAFNRKMIEEFAEGRLHPRLRSFTPSRSPGSAGTVIEGTFGGPKEKSAGENLGSQGDGQN